MKEKELKITLIKSLIKKKLGEGFYGKSNWNNKDCRVVLT